MAVHDLPRGIISGGCTTDPSIGFPMTLEEVSPKNRPEEAYPVLVIGTQVGRQKKSPAVYGTFSNQSSKAADWPSSMTVHRMLS